jgi:hypothetical protein
MADPTARLAGERWRSSDSGPGGAFIEGEVMEVSACAVVSGRGGAVLERGNFCQGQGCPWEFPK